VASRRCLAAPQESLKPAWSARVAGDPIAASREIGFRPIVETRHTLQHRDCRFRGRVTPAGRLNLSYLASKCWSCSGGATRLLQIPISMTPGTAQSENPYCPSRT